MMTYGDGVSDVDIPRLLEFHRSHGKLATVTTFRPISRFGILDIDEANQVLNFIEKPKSDAWASAGFFVFDRKVLDYIAGDMTTLEREPLERLPPSGSWSHFTILGSSTPWTRSANSRFSRSLEERSGPLEVWTSPQCSSSPSRIWITS